MNINNDNNSNLQRFCQCVGDLCTFCVTLVSSTETSDLTFLNTWQLCGQVVEEKRFRCMADSKSTAKVVALTLGGGTELQKLHICAFIEPLVVGKNKKCFFLQAQNTYIATYCISAQTVRTMHHLHTKSLHSKKKNQKNMNFHTNPKLMNTMPLSP